MCEGVKRILPDIIKSKLLIEIDDVVDINLSYVKLKYSVIYYLNKPWKFL